MFRKLFGIGDLTPEAFTKLVAKLGVERGTFINPALDLDAMVIRDEKQTMNLGNVYQAFRELPRKERLAFLEGVVLAPIAEPPPTWDAARELLVPVIRSGAYLTIAQLAIPNRDASQEIPRAPLAPGIFVTLVVDSPDRMALVNHHMLATWGKTFEEALAFAVPRLRASSQDPFHQAMPGVWLAPWTDCYGASRIVVPDVLHRVSIDPLIAIPNRDSLLVASSSDPKAFERLVDAIEVVADQPYAITQRIYRLEGTQLTEVEPPADAPWALKHRRMRIVEDARDYAEEARHRNEVAGEDEFWGSLMAGENDGKIETWVAWTKQVGVSFLPPAGTIGFVDASSDGKPDIWNVPWSVAAAVPGMLTPVDGALPRWRTGTFPDRAWLDQHGTRSDS